MKEAEAEKAEKRREDLLAGKLAVSCKPLDVPNVVPEPTSPIRATRQAVESRGSGSRSRQNASIIWAHFNGGPEEPEKWYWDNSTTLTSKRSICILCNTHVSASSTTNLRTHMQSAHKDNVINELKADEPLEVGKCVTLKSVI